jgi:hypothetical protein
VIEGKGALVCHQTKKTKMDRQMGSFHQAVAHQAVAHQAVVHQVVVHQVVEESNRLFRPKCLDD